MTKDKSVDRRIIHGVLVAVFNRGTLIRGGSGSGKSELALELISRGHKLVADDAVSVLRSADGLFGKAPELTAGVLALNGLGLIDVAMVFGKEALQAEANIELCIDLAHQPADDCYDLLSNNDLTKDILGVKVPLVRLDVSRQPANPVIIETAVKMLGIPEANAAVRVAAQHDSSIIRSSSIPQ